MNDCSSKICLGTVKLGVPDYGFSARSVAGDFAPLRFLAQVEAAGVHCFDTSPRYGQSEDILGAYLAKTSVRPCVSSKIDALLPGDSASPEKMLHSVRASLRRLNLSQLDICYLHQNELEIIADPYVHEGLLQLKDLGLIGATGASLYSHAECDYALDSELFDVIQVPVSIFDLSFYQRFIRNNNSAVRFAARSLLLQGILADRTGIDSSIRQAREVRDYLQQLDRLAKANGISTIALALSFVSSLPGISQYLLGTTSIKNLRQNIQSMNRPISQGLRGELVALAEQSKNWTNPRNWVG